MFKINYQKPLMSLDQSLPCCWHFKFISNLNDDPKISDRPSCSNYFSMYFRSTYNFLRIEKSERQEEQSLFSEKPQVRISIRRKWIKWQKIGGQDTHPCSCYLADFETNKRKMDWSLQSNERKCMDFRSARNQYLLVQSSS